MASEAPKEMTAQIIAAMTAKAVSTVLLHKTSKLIPAADILASGLDQAVKSVFNLRDLAKDPPTAHLEIACDAAQSYAEKWNPLHPDDFIEPRWVYTVVQALLVLDLKPSAIDDLKRIDPKVSLLPWFEEQQRRQQSRNRRRQRSESVTSPGAADDDDDDDDEDDRRSVTDSLTELSSDGMAATDEPRGAGASERKLPLMKRTGASKASSPLVVEAKTPWSDNDIQSLITWRAKGLTHAETSELLGRGQGSVENKYGRVVKEERWIPVVRSCAAKYHDEKKRRRQERRREKKLAARRSQTTARATSAKSSAKPKKTTGMTAAVAAEGDLMETDEAVVLDDDEEAEEVVVVGGDDEEEDEEDEDEMGSERPPVKSTWKAFNVAKEAGLE